MHTTNDAKSSLSQRCGRGSERRLCVFLPWSPLFTPLTGTDVRLRGGQLGEDHVGKDSSLLRETDSSDPNALLPLPWHAAGVNSALPSWRCLPANPLCATTTPTPPRQNTQAAMTRVVDNDPTKPSQVSFQGNTSLPTPKQRLLDKEDHAYYCDACQKGFKQKEKYDLHMSQHIYCDVAGCGFTCRGDRKWKMEEHVNMLHNRPNAPDLVDVGRYLDQRRARFPTQDAVKQKVEELYYKAACGVMLPEERRRWVRQHGVHIGKHYRSEHTYIAHGKPPDETMPNNDPPPSQQCSKPKESNHNSHPDKNEENEANRLRDQRVGTEETQPESASLARNVEEIRASSSSSSRNNSSASARSSGRVVEQDPTAISQNDQKDTEAKEGMVKVLPFVGQASSLHCSSRLAQRVEQQRREGQVPRYYVCNRCGVKGSHWLSDCPTKGDSLYDRHMVWGEPKRSKIEAGTKPTLNHPNSLEKEDGEELQSADDSQVEKQQVEGELEGKKVGVHPADDSYSEHPDIANAQTPLPRGDLSNSNKGCEGSSEDDALPPPKVTARVVPEAVGLRQPKRGEESGPSSDLAASVVTKEIGRMFAPVAAKKYLQARIRQKENRSRGGRNSSRLTPVPTQPTLYERLTEEDRLNEKGLLLQAIRFFVARDFFC